MKLRKTLSDLRHTLITEHGRILLAGLLFCGLFSLLFLFRPAWVRAFDSKYHDLVTNAVLPAGPADTAVIIDIDEASLKEYGQWPWPRFLFAVLLEKTLGLGASSIGIDFLFAEPDRSSPLRFQEQLKQLAGVEVPLDAVPVELRDFDAVLAQVLRDSPICLGFSFLADNQRETDQRTIEQRKIGQDCRLRQVNVALRQDPGVEQGASDLITAPDVDCNLPQLDLAASASGFFNANADPDGIIRRMPMVIKHERRHYTNLALCALMQARQLRQLSLHIGELGLDAVFLGEHEIPVDRSGRFLIHFPKKSRTFRYIAAADILSDRVPPDSLQGQIAFIGTSAIGLKDIRYTPTSAEFPGVEVHATVVDNIIHRDYLEAPPWITALEFLLIIGIGLVSTFFFVFTRAFWSLVAIFLVFAGLLGGTIWALVDYSLLISPLYPGWMLATNFALITLLKFRKEEELKRFLQKTFSAYLAPELIESMYRSRTYPELGGEVRQITAFFSDIKGFSTFSEKLTATQLVELLNEYLSAMTEILLAEGGTLDKYEGDAIVAFFGAPAQLPDHALRACRASIRMQRRLAELAVKWSQERIPPGAPERNTKGFPPEQWRPGDRWPLVVHSMQMRIGLNCGEAVVGNMGSLLRMNYTMMGDPVNLAARLESAGKQYGVRVLVSRQVLEARFPGEDGREQAVREQLASRPIDKIAVVGKSEPTEVFEVLGLQGELTEREQQLLPLFQAGIERYRSQDWAAALDLFAQAQDWERFPDAPVTPSLVYQQRCRAYLEHPPVAPGAPWDGVYRLVEK